VGSVCVPPAMYLLADFIKPKWNVEVVKIM
jgi:hypothetical protein